MHAFSFLEDSTVILESILFGFLLAILAVLFFQLIHSVPRHRDWRDRRPRISYKKIILRLMHYLRYYNKQKPKRLTKTSVIMTSLLLFNFLMMNLIESLINTNEVVVSTR